jgi:uncharacterized protein YbaP (TraB family)
LLATAGIASAAPPACTGQDLLAQMQQQKPETYKALREEADAVPNGKGLLWRIDAASGAKPSFLFGTVHLTDDRVHALAAPARQALDTAATVIVESTEALGVSEMAKHLFSVATLMVLPEGETLDTIIPPADLAVVKAYYQRDVGGYEAVAKYRPYMLALTLSYPPCEAARQAVGLESLDAEIAAATKVTGAKLAGLETLAEQFGSIASMPMTDQVAWLLQAIKFASEIDNITETLVRLYLVQDTGMLLAWSRYLAIENGTEKVWMSFKDILIDTRNRRMAERAVAFIERGNAFIAVGALHLPGETGLVQLLRGEGYTLTPIH